MIRMLRLLVLILAVWLAPSRHAVAFFEQTEVGARGVAMGRTFSAVADDASAIYWNPGGLGALEQPEVFLTHHRPYLLEDLSLNFAGVAWPVSVGTASGTVWGAWSHLGLSGVMSEDLFYLGLADEIDLGEGRQVRLGGSLKIARLGFDGAVATGAGPGRTLDSETAVTGDLGVLLQLSPRLSAGWTIRNLGKPEFDLVPGAGGTTLDLVHEGGIAYRWHPESRIALAFVEASDGDLEPVVGAEIGFYDVFVLRAGIGKGEETIAAASNLRFHGGVGVTTERLRVDTAFVTHDLLGISSMVSVVVPIGGWR